MIMVCSVCLLPSLSDLPPPNVTISFSGSSTAGQSYSLNCSATVVPGLVTEPDVQLVFSDSTKAEGSSSVEQSFSPLRTSDGGQYTCTATVNIPQAGIANSSSTTETVTVQSELVCCVSCSLNLSLSLHSSPTQCVILWSSGISSGSLSHHALLWNSLHSLVSSDSGRGGGHYCLSTH